ncbi:U7 snRNA-associated Sm-like protein LSm11 [Rhopalosiphum maidis]|uniref:U7 snRNA-associated Sm-like protein LSm11 n=1 Tax=Rhopalosiphum maidis TaxID=43146 RepID=UPI000EFEE676|nr:U7 snRNA-associated Sm-like protein LSm11 [Rhopalosiphum maidis]
MSSSTDEELDMLSPSFNPIKALYANDVKVPSTTAQPLDNISKFELAPSGEVLIKPDRLRKVNEYNIKPIKRDLSGVAGTSQISLVQRIIKQRRTVLARMSEISKSRGPLSRIATFCYSKQRVRVYIRSAVSVRGHCEGYIIAYDKHWNLVMDDVDEVWTRKNKYKSLAFGDVKSLVDPVEKPYAVVKRIRGHQVCRRHVPRFLVRGEQIVLVAKCRS